MIVSQESHSIATLLQVLAGEQLTSAELLFLTRRLSYDYSATAWVMLSAFYGHNEKILRDIERRVLMRMSFEGLKQVRALLSDLTDSHPASSLTASEQSNLNALVEYALLLQTIAQSRHEKHPDPASLLADTTRRRTSKSKTARPAESPLAPAPALPTEPSARSSQVIPPSVANKKQPSTRHQPDGTLSDCPSVIMTSLKQPETFLEGLVQLNDWLTESPRSVGEVRYFMWQKWRSSYADLQSALDLLYALGVIAPSNADPVEAIVRPTLAANLSIRQFRRACADAFAHRVEGNTRLLSALDQLNEMSPNRIQRVAFGDVPVFDLITRLTLWEALGVVQHQKKDQWTITQGGRDLVMTLPSLGLMIADEQGPVPLETDDDWLNVL